MTNWYGTIYKEAAKGFGDFVYEVYLQDEINLSESSFTKNVGGPGKSGGKFQHASPNSHERILEQAQRTKAARKDVTDYVKFKYGKLFKDAYNKLVLRAKDKEEIKNGFADLRKMYPIPDKLIQTFKEEYEKLNNIDFETESQNIDAQQIYTDLIAPEIYNRREKGEIIFIYEKNSFKMIYSRYDAIKRPFFRLRDSIKINKYTKENPVTGKKENKKQIVSYDQDALNQVVEGLIKVNELKLGELQSKSLYEVALSNKAVRSFHEFAIRDILAICGVDFDIEVPFQIMGSTVYKENPVVDFVLPGQELFEIFGDSRGDYDERKKEKIDKLPNLWYVDYGEKMSRLSMEQRTLSMYCESLNTQCYTNKTKDSSAGALQGKDYVQTLEARVPLLGVGHIAKLDFYWQWAMDLPAETLRTLRDKVKMIQTSPEYQPLPISTAQYNESNKNNFFDQNDITDYITEPPNIKEIFSSLLSGKVAEGATPFNFPDGDGFSKSFISNVSGHELIALYFQTPEAIMPYLEHISNDLDSQEMNNQQNLLDEDTLQQDMSEQDLPPQGEQSYDFSSYHQPLDPTMEETKDEPRLRAAKSNKIMKTASIDLSEKDFNERMKQLIKSNDFFSKLFNIYEVPLDVVGENLKFHIIDLDGRHAKSKGNDIYINSKLLRENDNVEEVLHFVVHEMIHWLTRQREKMCYFSDPEELEAFALGMAFELKRGQSEEKIREIYFPIIQAHFKEDDQAEKMYKEFLKSAYVLNKNIFS